MWHGPIVEKRFCKSFSDCINHLIGKIKYNCFEGIEEFYEKELTNLEENENFKEILIYILFIFIFYFLFYF